MTKITPSKTDLMYEIIYNPTFVPLPSSKVNVRTTVVDGKPSYLMKNHITGTYYDLDELSNIMWNLIDGKNTVEQIVKGVQRQKPDVRERTVIETLLFFAEAQLLEASAEPTPRKRFKIVSAFEIDFCIIERSNDFLQSIDSKLRPILKRPLLWTAVAFILMGVLFFAGEFVSIYGKKANFQILGSSVVGFFFYYFVALAPAIAIHEIAHGLALVHYGGKPGEMGTGLFYFGPMFYTETTDAWGLSKRDRIMVYLAGNITTLLIGSALVFIRFIVRIPEPASHVLTMMAFYCFNLSLFNFAPPFESDGYYILLDVVNMPYLRRDAYNYLGSTIRRALGMQVKTKIPGLTKRRKRILLGYAVLSVTWITYLVFQSSLFLVYMGQDITAALAKIAQAVLSSQALPTSVVVIAVLSTIYFGMQVAGYGFVFSVAVRKATAKSLRIEAIHDRDLAVLTYLPPQVPESLSNSLRARMESTAKKFTSNFETMHIGRSCVTVLRMGGTSLALVQIKEHLKRVESKFSSAYQDFIIRHRESLKKSSGIYAPDKIRLTTLLRRVAEESVDAGNPGVRSIVRLCEEKQNENLLCLLSSVFGTVWTIEVQPALEYDIQKELAPGLLLEDLTLTDLYNDTENFKKRFVYGFDSLSKLATEIDAGVKQSLARPGEYQSVCVLEPIKSRIVFVGRTEQIEKNIHALAPLFVAQTWSGYLDNLLSETCFSLSTLNRTHLPSAKEIKEMSTGELAVLTKDLSAFRGSQELVEKCVQKSEDNLTTVNQSLERLKTTLKPSETFQIGLLDTMFHVNIENLEAVPNRVKEFRKEWKTLCKSVEKIREHVEKEYDQRKPMIERKKRKMLRIYPLFVALSILFSLMTLLPYLALWRTTFLSVALVLQVFYWILFYRVWRSLHKVTKYPSQAFSRIQLFVLALTEAIYGYVTTGDVLTPL